MKSRPAPLSGVALLAADAVVGTTSVVESMHRAIARSVWPGPASGIARLVYASVRGVSHGIGQLLDRLLRALPSPALDGPRGEAWRAALNGVCGDHLERTGNPLALEMTLRRQGATFALDRSGLAASIPGATSHVLILAHGLCMSDGQWLRNGHDHGAALECELGCTVVHVRYNTGRHVADNGRDLAALIERLVAHWPVPATRLTLIGHSMGGLVLRSACAEAGRASMTWTSRLRELVTLGTPHRGAPLERAGRWLEMALASTPYSAPLTAISALRSAGISDLRDGRVDRPGVRGRGPCGRLPRGVRGLALAAMHGNDTDSSMQRAIGDGLVPVASALGRETRRRSAPGFEAWRTRIVTGIDHLALLDSQEVYLQLREWLQPATPRSRAVR